MTKVFLDTNVVLYTLAEGDPRRPIARTRLAQGGTISVQVLNKFATVARRKLKLSWPEVYKALAVVRTLCPPPVPLTLATHEAALALASQHSFSLYDALIVASALEAGCDTLLSEDMQHGRVIDARLTITNPFRQP